MEFNPIHPKMLANRTTQSYYNQNLRSADLEKDPKALGSLFESMFYRMILKEMRQSEMGDSIFDSTQFQQIREMQDDELANHLGQEGHLGISKMISDYVEKMSAENVIQPANFNQIGEHSTGLLKPPSIRR